MGWLDSSGKAQQLTAFPATVGYSQPRVSPDGKRLVFISRDAIWLYDLERDNQTRLVLFPPPISFPVWTPDSARIAFASDAEDKQGIWWVRADGKGEPQRLTQARTRNIQRLFLETAAWHSVKSIRKPATTPGFCRLTGAMPKRPSQASPSHC
jgi:Tol biopolymer transport system component